MGWHLWLPFPRWWGRVDRHTLKCDSVAELTGGIIAVPRDVAFATVAGMPPEHGLYAAMTPAIVAALWGSPWHLMSGPTTAISVVVFAAICPLAPASSDEYVRLVLTLTLIVGLFQLLLTLCKNTPRFGPVFRVQFSFVRCNICTKRTKRINELSALSCQF